MLDALVMSDLVHQTLERALRTLEVDGSLANAAPPVTQLGRETVNGLTFELGAPWKGALPQRVRIPPGNCRSSR